MSERAIPRRERAIDMPMALLAFIAALLAVHALRSVLSDPSDVELVVEGGFIPARWSILIGWAAPEEIVRHAARSVADPDVAAARLAIARYVAADDEPHAWSILSYALLHGSWMHVGLNCVWLAAFGTPVVRRLGAVRSAVVALATALGGALAFWVADPLGAEIVIGASGIVSGFMGAAATFVFDAEGRSGWSAVLRNRSAFIFLAFWVAANALGGVFAGQLGIVEGAIAWQAHLGGLVVGILICPLLDPFRTETA